VGLNSLQNTAGKRNLEKKLKRLNFGTDHMLETSEKSLGLKIQTESKRLHKDRKTKKKKIRLLNILSQPAVEPCSRTRYLKSV